MKKDHEALENFIVESAADGLNEIFGEAYADKVAAYQEENPKIADIENQINFLLGKYWDLQVMINGGSINGNGYVDEKAKRAACMATLNFIADIGNKYRANLPLEAR